MKSIGKMPHTCRADRGEKQAIGDVF